MMKCCIVFKIMPMTPAVCVIWRTHKCWCNRLTLDHKHYTHTHTHTHTLKQSCLSAGELSSGINSTHNCTCTHTFTHYPLLSRLDSLKHSGKLIYRVCCVVVILCLLCCYLFLCRSFIIWFCVTMLHHFLRFHAPAITQTHIYKY